MGIRKAKTGDYGWIIATHGEVYRDQFSFDGDFEFTIADKLVTYFRQPQEGNRIWIAEVNGERAGSIGISSRPGNIGFVNFVLVLDKFRGQGIAGKLMGEMMGFAKQHGYRELRLETYTLLTDARNLYARLGFNIVESQTQNRFGLTLTQEFWELELR